MPFIGNMGAGEMIFVMLVLLLVFGAKKLPELGSGLGKGIREFKRSMRDMTDEVARAEEPKEIRSPIRPAAVPPASESVNDSSDRYGN